MKTRFRSAGTTRPWRNLLARLVSDRSGVAAIEFAFIAPLLLAMCFVTVEVSQGIETNKKLGRAASTVADLVTQQQTITTTQIGEIMDVGKAILKPYGRSNLKFVATAIEVTDEATPKVKVVWSQASAGATAPCNALVKGAATDLPQALKVRRSFIVRVVACLDYKPVVTWAAGSEAGLGVLSTIFKNGVLKMDETYYLRPRITDTIPCSNC